MKNVKKVLFSFILILLSLFIFGDTVDAAGISTGTYTCTYKGQVDGKSLKIEKKEVILDNVINSNTSATLKWNVNYPDGSNREYYLFVTDGNKFPTDNCEDIFYSAQDNKIFAVDRGSFYYNQTIQQYCSTYDDLEQYCANDNCKIDVVPCGNTSLETEWGTCPAILLPVIKFLKIVVFNTLQIFVPIILILMGTIDLVKAVMASDDKATKDATGKLIKRVITAILIFFITTIVNIVMNMLASADIEGFEDWKACWFYDHEEEVATNEEE